jgi:cobalt-precorrin-5B (C1)-methyltransferase
VGRVTLPGLPVSVGQAAINPGPRAQITKAAREALAEVGYQGAVRLVLMVANGEKIAAKTLNPRLGIVGGISILGTTGIVKPFSHEAWQATIASGLAVAKAMGVGVDLAALTTGRKSERLLMAQRPDLPPWAFIQAADYFAFALKLAADQGFERIVWGCFFGKLLKMAQGLEYTHAKAGASDMALLAQMAQACGASPETVAAVARANTARHALELMDPGVRPAFASRVAAKALDAARRFAGPGPGLEIVCFDFSGELLTRASSENQPG